jgi:hypothetical protein
VTGYNSAHPPDQDAEALRIHSCWLATLGLAVSVFLPPAVALAAAVESPPGEVSAHTLGDLAVRGRLIFSERFEDRANWKSLAPRTTWTTEDGVLKGNWAPGGSAIWLDREFHGNILIIAEARVLPPDPVVRRGRAPEGGKNFNIRFHVRGPHNQDILDVYRDLLKAGTGPNGIGDDQYRGYFVTWTGRHSRLRRSPGYVNVSESTAYLPVSGQRHRIELLFLDGRILYRVDGHLLHDYTDPEPFTQGRIALVTWNSNVEVSRFDVYQIAVAGG